MYDVKAKIDKSEQHLQKIIKHDIAKGMDKNNLMTLDTVKKALESFVIAKFRTTITDSAEHYLKLFFNVIGDEDTANLDGARFMEMMDSLNIESLGSEHKAYSFAMRAKDMMRKVTSGEKLNAEEIMTDFKELLKNEERVVEVVSKDFSNDLL